MNEWTQMNEWMNEFTLRLLLSITSFERRNIIIIYLYYKFYINTTSGLPNALDRSNNFQDVVSIFCLIITIPIERLHPIDMKIQVIFDWSMEEKLYFVIKFNSIYEYFALLYAHTIPGIGNEYLLKILSFSTVGRCIGFRISGRYI